MIIFCRPLLQQALILVLVESGAQKGCRPIVELVLYEWIFSDFSSWWWKPVGLSLFFLQNLPFLLGAYLFLLVLWNDVIIGQLLPSNEYCQFTIPLVCLTDYCSFCTFQVLLPHIKYLFTDFLQNSCCLNLLTCWWILDVCSYETKDVCVIKGCFFLAYWCTNSYRKRCIHGCRSWLHLQPWGD
mgnify:FL=1